jgi:hypothetical protein
MMYCLCFYTMGVGRSLIKKGLNLNSLMSDIVDSGRLKFCGIIVVLRPMAGIPDSLHNLPMTVVKNLPRHSAMFTT